MRFATRAHRLRDAGAPAGPERGPGPRSRSATPGVPSPSEPCRVGAAAGASVPAPRVAITVNERIAQRLEEVAELLEAQRASAFRVGAYRRGARALRTLSTDVDALVGREGRAGLEALPGIGRGLAGVILELLDTGTLRLLDRLHGALSPEDLFVSVPGIGPELARRIHEALGVETLEELEAAAWDGRLERVPGFGSRRLEALRALLDSRLSRYRRRRGHELAALSGVAPRRPPEAAPSVADLLSVDTEYRSKAEARILPVIVPRRFNPKGTAWLPVLHTERGAWSFHAFFSNTPLAQRLGRTRDWVVVCFEMDGDTGQATVLTERGGDLHGLRVVRGREEACRRHHQEGRP